MADAHRKGWANLHKGHYIAYIDRRAEDKRSVSVGAVLEGIRQDRTVLVHCMCPCHDTVNLKWKRLYFTPPAEGDKETFTVTANPKTEPVLYAAIRMQVDLLVEGELNYASARALDRRGLRFYIPPREVVRLCQQGRPQGVTQNPINYLLLNLENLTVATRGRTVRLSLIHI